MAGPPKRTTQQQAARKARRQRRAQRRMAARQTVAVDAGRGQAMTKVRQAHEPYQLQVGMMLTEFLTTPHDAPLIRMPTVDMPRTAVIRLRDQLSVTGSTATGYGPTWGAGDMVYILYGQPGRMLEYGPITPPSVGAYRINFQPTVLGSAAVDNWTLENVNLSGSLPHADMWPIASTTFESGTNYVGSKQRPIGKDQGINFVYLGNKEGLFITDATGTSTLTGSANFEVIRFQEDGVSPVAVIRQCPLVGGLPTKPFGLVYGDGVEAGYYAVRYLGITAASGSSTTPITIKMQIQLTVAGNPLFIQRYAPELDSDPTIGTLCRRTAASLLVTNTTSLNSRQGTVTAARLTGATYNTVTVGRMTTATEKYVGDAANGAYTYMSFSSTDEEFAEAVNRDYGGIFYSLTPPDYSHVVWTTNPSVATAANSYAVSVDCVLEFMTDSQRYNMDVPHFAHGELIEARRIANATPFFYENPLHMADITKFVRSAWNAVRRNAVPIADFVTAVQPAFGPAAQYIARRMK